MFSVGTKVILLTTEEDSLQQVLEEGVITRVSTNGDIVWLDNPPSPKGCRYNAFIFPDIPECRKLLEDTLEMQAKHKAESDALYVRQVQLNNALIHNGLK
jgi:hypothetical protein